MTTVYGVTEYGARLQIEKQLKDIGILIIYFKYTPPDGDDIKSPIFMLLLFTNKGN